MIIYTTSKGILVFVLLTIAITSPALSATRHCDAKYSWETTGGTLKGSFGKFKSKGSCGNTVPNRCRIRASDAAMKCMGTQWAIRWDRKIPEACYSASDVLGYDISLKCSDTPSGNCTLLNEANNPIGSNKEVAKNGDIKSRLEAEVCCVFAGGNVAFPNEKNVHVRLTANVSGDKKCGKKKVLVDDYKIDCVKTRREICRQFP